MNKHVKFLAELFVIVFVYWLGYQSAVFNMEMGGKLQPFSPYVCVEKNIEIGCSK